MTLNSPVDRIWDICRFSSDIGQFRILSTQGDNRSMGLGRLRVRSGFRV